MDFAVPADHRENQRKRKKRQVLGAVERESNGDRNSNWGTLNGSKRLGKETGRAGNQRTNCDLPNYSIVKIGQITEKSPGDLWRLAIIHTPVKDYELTRKK